MVFAIAALGGAYAMWYDNLFVNETVSTGYVNVEWCACSDTDDPSPNYTGYEDNVFEGSLDRIDPGNPNEQKNIGYLDASESSDEALEGDLPPLADGVSEFRFDNDLLTITLGNGYPGYQQKVFTRIRNRGTVPVKFELLGTEEIPSWMHLQIYDSVNKVMLFDNQAEIDLLTGKQLDPEKAIYVHIIERVLQEAPQQASDTFTLQLKGIQWNEYDFQLPTVITADAAQ